METTHFEIQFYGGKITAHHWLYVPKALLSIDEPLSVDNLHMTARLYFAYVDHVFSGLVRSIYNPPDAVLKSTIGGKNLLWFSGIWSSANGNESHITMQIQNGGLVHPNHYNQGRLQFKYLMETRGGTGYLGFHFILTDYVSRIRGEGHHPSIIRQTLFRMTENAIYRYIAVSFTRRLTKLLQGEETTMKKMFGISDKDLSLWVATDQIPEQQTLVPLSD
ncbi:MAG: hypothetical protein K9N46_03665 [Candidatus Marinimicrobia bacterium]|nr:hypothetical protein [Candidatus Neomarinimicrobiota bacterium]MCF7829660.1 hypothetical protein [Candidatus Neomarinimicrobiota bacterium]MCF7879820.1 hypothetical protein [Candidatus Neomarinimicrobiota bacterium]